MLSPVTAPPPQISPEEHAAMTSSTPSEFTSAHRNPPILRYHDDAASCSLSPSHGFWDGQKNGALWVTEEAVSFLPSGSSGWTLPYTSLTLHALTPASSEAPAHLYLQSDESDAPKVSAPTQNGDGVNGHGEADENEDEGDFTPMREIRVFVGADKCSWQLKIVLKVVQDLFGELSRCSALHASLMPNGEPSSFGFFPSNDDIDDEDEEDDEGAWEDADEDAGDGNGEGDGPGRLPNLSALRLSEETASDDGEDPVEDFLAKVDWGNVPKPEQWAK